MISPKFLLLLVAFFLTLSVKVYCGNPATLKEVHVGIYQYNPLVYIDNKNQPSGLFINIIEDIARKNNWQIKYTVGTWQENLDMLKAGKIDLVLGIAMNSIRSKEFDLNKEPVVSSWVQIYAKKDNPIKTILDLDKKNIVALKGDSFFEFFKETINNYDIHPNYIEKDNIQNVFQYLDNHPNDFAACEWIAGIKFKNEYKLIETPIMLIPSAMGFATSKGKNQELLNVIDHYILDGETNPHSTFQNLKLNWLQDNREWEIPQWLKWSLIIGISFFVLAILTILVSRYQVNQKTRILEVQNKKLIQAEEELVKTISLMESTLQATTDGILVVDNNKKISSYSKRFLKIWQIPDQDLIGIDNDKLMLLMIDQLKDPEAFISKTNEIYRLNKTSSFDTFELKDGRIFERYSRQQIINNESVGRVLSIRNVTEREQMLNSILEREKDLATSNSSLKELNDEYLTLNEEYISMNLELTANQDELKRTNLELMRAKKKAEEADHLKSAFLSNMSHEIRTPMNAILGFSSLMDMPDLTEKERKDFINIIRQRGEDLLNIIDDILDISKIESGQLKIVESITDINLLFRDIQQIFKLGEQFKNKSGIDLVSQNNLPNQAQTILLDSSRIKQIFLNLIGNAYKFTETGAIEYGCELREPMLLFYVKDSGIGIPPDKLTMIFERFRQVNESFLNNTKGGAGLGLSICKGLIDLMGGDICVDSEEGTGSTFWFSIPFKQSDKKSS